MERDRNFRHNNLLGRSGRKVQLNDGDNLDGKKIYLYAGVSCLTSAFSFIAPFYSPYILHRGAGYTRLLLPIGRRLGGGTSRGGNGFVWSFTAIRLLKVPQNYYGFPGLCCSVTAVFSSFSVLLLFYLLRFCPYRR